MSFNCESCPEGRDENGALIKHHEGAPVVVVTPRRVTYKEGNKVSHGHETFSESLVCHECYLKMDPPPPAEEKLVTVREGRATCRIIT